MPPLATELVSLNRVGWFSAGMVLLGGAASTWLILTPRPEVPPERSRGGDSEPQDHPASSYPASSYPAAPNHSGDGKQSPFASGTAAPQPAESLVGVPTYDGPDRDPQRATALREALAAMYAERLEAEARDAGGVDTMPGPVGDGNQADAPLGDYVRRVMAEQFVPLAVSCYEELLERNRGAAGHIELAFSIMGHPSVGGVVVDVELAEGTTLDDPTFATCVRESMYSVVFDAPPGGRGTLSVTQGFSLEP